jgi:AcrR family transcriptional regulator
MTILQAAGDVLLRYGYRKASVDEVARQAHVSRPGLYLLFSSKDELFTAAIEALFMESITRTRAALIQPDQALGERIANAFAALSGAQLPQRLEEVFDVVERLTGKSSTELEEQIVAEFATALRDSPSDSPWRRHGDTPDEVARILYATSSGLKHLAHSTSNYLAAIRQAIRFVISDD